MLRKSSICVLFVFLLLLGSAYALTAKLGSPRVVLYPEVTPSNPALISRNLEVINSNNISVHIKLEVSENCTDIIKISSSESEFTLQPDKSKAVPYVVKVTQPGFYECKINTYFTEEKEGKKGPGVALAAVVIINARGKGPDLPSGTDNRSSNDTAPPTPDDNDTSDGVSISTGGNNPTTPVNNTSYNPSAFAIVFFVLLLAVVGLLAFFVIKSRRAGNAKV